MNSTRFLLTLTILLTASLALSAQSLSTYSPYSRYGIGEVRNQGYANNKALGGMSQGLRNGTWVNYLNPASYTAQDTMSFIFDFGIEGTGVDYKSGDQSNFNSHGNIQHIALQFPIAKWMGASAGIQPYSNVGYRIRHIETNDTLLSAIGPIKYNHDGSGGITQAYLGLAVEPIKNLSVGMNMSYFFGSLEHTTDVLFPTETAYNDIRRVNSVVVRDIALSFGAQYTQYFGEENDFKLVLGATLDNETSIGAQSISVVSYPHLGASDTISYEENPKSSIDFPKNISAGFSLSYKDRFMGGAEYSTQDWSNAKFLGVSDSLSKSETVRVGVQYTPNPQDLRSYFKRVSYRLGAYHSNTYLELRNKQIEDYGITFGVGLPFRRSKTSFNLSFELGRKGTLDNNLVQETYGIVNIGFTFYDIWFVKRKFN